jgi:hypothetical protein
MYCSLLNPLQMIYVWSVILPSDLRVSTIFISNADDVSI